MKATSIGGKAIAVVSALFLFCTSAIAQDDDGGPQTWGDDAVYINVTHVAFKPGMRSDAMQIIAEHFVPAGEASGAPGPMLAVHYQTGKWDAMFIWVYEGGLKDEEWFVSPNNIKWRAALAEQEGSDEAAAELLARYQSMVANAISEIGHYHTGAETDD